MTGAELLERLAALEPDELALPVVTLGCNRPDAEGVEARDGLPDSPWVPPCLAVVALDASMSHQWAGRG